VFRRKDDFTMATRVSMFAFLIARLLIGLSQAPADDTPDSDLKRLHVEVRKLVEKHYPNGKVTLKNQTIHFEFNARKFMIHEPLLSGEWQNAHEELGPQKGGIYGDIELRVGEYMGQANVPQTFNKHYFTLLLLAPYSQKNNQHLYVHLKYPGDVPKEFLEAFKGLANGFEAYVTPIGKQR
jgi:hypothetical protein